MRAHLHSCYQKFRTLVTSHLLVNRDQTTRYHHPAPHFTFDRAPLLFQFSHLIFDMTSVGFTDTASTRSLVSLIKEYEAIEVACYLVGCNGESRTRPPDGRGVRREGGLEKAWS